MTIAFISIGSNIKPRYENCLKAIEELSSNKNINIEVVSNWYETTPLPPAKKTDSNFINGVIRIKTSLSEVELLAVCKEIEMKLGRIRPVSGAPRPIDLDIILFGDRIINADNLKIPHPKISERLFVLMPFCDINPEVVHPIFKKKFVEMLNEKIKHGGINENIHRYS